MKFTEIPLAHTVIQHCKSRGIKNIVISPGSRNAPLTLGFTGDPYFHCYSIVDERSAAFFALGISQHLQQAVAVVCTSGSALLNYYPAVAEAFYSNIPLVVISADRPGYKIDIGDGQTIRQDHVFHRHILNTALLEQDVIHGVDAIRAAGISLPAESSELTVLQEKIQQTNDQLLNRAFRWRIGQMGPVHINVPMEEPLYGLQDTAVCSPEIDEYTPEESKPMNDLEPFENLWAGAEKKMVIIGAANPGYIDSQYLELLARDPSVLVFTETTSNCHHPEFFPSIDCIIAPIEASANRETLFRDLQPTLLITLGGMVVSKKIKAFLRLYRPAHHWHISPGRPYDTYYSLTHHFKVLPDQFFASFRHRMTAVESRYKKVWDKAKSRYRLNRAEYLNRIPFSDMLAFDKVLASIPPLYQVQLANSTVIRYAQLFDLNHSLRVFCNRGTSGIDGSTSTAVGASIYDEQPTVFITGDLSFLYDSNGLWNNYIRSDFRIIVINNQGGGIFRILPGSEESEDFERFFETVQRLDIGKLCALYGLEHRQVSGADELSEALIGFYGSSPSARVLEILTPRTVNNKILLAYFDLLSYYTIKKI